MTEAAKTIHFANYGAQFRDISALYIAGYAAEGSGAPDLAMDNLKFHWNRPSPRNESAPSWHPHFQRPYWHPHHMAPAVPAQHGHVTAGPESGTGRAAHFYHSELGSLAGALGHHDPGVSLVDQFALPHVEHFGM